MVQIFKIQNRESGEFATATGWSKNGKQWNKKGHVKLHLQGDHKLYSYKYQNSDLVTYELVEVSREPMYGIINQTYEEKKKKDHAYEIKSRQWALERAKRELEEAQKRIKELENY